MSKKEILAGNLQELCAVSRSDKPHEELVTDPWGVRFYSRSSWQGRVLLFFYNRLDGFDKAWRAQALHKAMERTHRYFHRLSEKAKHHSSTIAAAIEARVDGRYVQEGELRDAKRFLLMWNRSTQPFLASLKKASYQFNEIILTGFFTKGGQSLAERPFGDYGDAKEFSRHQKLIDFEGYVGSAIPLALLFKAACGKQLSERETESLGKFARKLHRYKNEIGMHNLDKYLRAIAHCFRQISDEAQWLTMVKKLFKLNMPLFQSIDETHFEWRRQFQPGDKLNCNGIEIILGNSIGPKENGVDNHLVFEAANAPGLVVDFGKNRIMPHLRPVIAKKYGYGFENPTIVMVEEKGKFSLIEKLNVNLGEYLAKLNWQHELTPEEEKLVLPFANSIAWFLKNGATPRFLSAQYLGFDQNGVLKSTKIGGPAGFDFNALEECAWNAAAKNPFIFKFIMEKSGMRDDSIAEYYREVVRKAAMGEDPEEQLLSQVREITDYRVVDKARELVQNVQIYKAAAIDQCRRNNFYHKDLDRIAGEAVIAAYNYYSTATIFFLHLSGTIYIEICRRLQQGESPS